MNLPLTSLLISNEPIAINKNMILYLESYQMLDQPYGESLTFDVSKKDENSKLPTASQ